MSNKFLKVSLHKQCIVPKDRYLSILSLQSSPVSICSAYSCLSCLFQPLQWPWPKWSSIYMGEFKFELDSGC